MKQAIIFKNDDGNVCVIYPSPEVLSIYGIEAIALKDVPVGKPFKIVNVEVLPDRSQRDAWEIDEALLNDGIGSDSSVFQEVM